MEIHFSSSTYYTTRVKMPQFLRSGSVQNALQGKIVSNIIEKRCNYETHFFSSKQWRMLFFRKKVSKDDLYHLVLQGSLRKSHNELLAKWLTKNSKYREYFFGNLISRIFPAANLETVNQVTSLYCFTYPPVFN